MAVIDKNTFGLVNVISIDCNGQFSRIMVKAAHFTKWSNSPSRFQTETYENHHDYIFQEISVR